MNFICCCYVPYAASLTHIFGEKQVVKVMGALQLAQRDRAPISRGCRSAALCPVLQPQH